MKSLVLSLVLALASSNAFAMAKNCEGANNDPNTKGVTIDVQVTQKNVEVADGDFKGKYAANKKSASVKGKDGKTYLSYNWGGEEGCSEVLVDENLLTSKGKGWIKFRCRGEGFGDSKFMCKPAK